MVKTRVRGMKVAAAVAIGFLIVGMSATMASADENYTDVSWATPVSTSQLTPPTASDSNIWPQTLANPNTCGVWLQVDRYKTGPGTDALIATGVLLGGYQDGDLLAWSYSFSSGHPWKYIQAPNCVTPPPPPTPTPICGADNDTVSLPSATGVSYSTAGWTNNSITITAATSDSTKYTLTGTTSWTFTDAATACPVTVITVTPPPPTVVPSCGPNNDTVTIPTATGVTYSNTGWTNNSLTITATTSDSTKYKLTGDTSWTFTDTDTSCTVTAVAASVVDPPVCGPNNDVISVPTTEGVVYADTGWVTGERTITATAKTGYTLVGTASWTFTDASTVCPVTTEPPTVVAKCFPNNDTVTIPDVDGVVYSDTGWADGKRTITAAAATGYTLTGDMSWTFTDVPSAGCPIVGPVFSGDDPGSLAFTGIPATTGGLVALAILLIIGGTVLAIRKVRA